MFGGSYTVDFGDHPQGIFRMGSGTAELQSTADGASALTYHSANVSEEPYLLCGSGGTIGSTTPTSYGGFSSDFGIAQPEPLDGASPQ